MSIKNKTFIHYVPHGINPKTFYPLNKNDKNIVEMKKKLFNNKEYDYVVFFNSRNINRKRVSNLILGYRTFCDNLPKEKAQKCCLVLHTEKILDAGTDLPVTIQAMCPHYDVIITEDRYLPEQMNVIYNIADVTVNISSNEGFGLSCAESIMCGTPVIVAVTGGLQDQIGQVDDSGNPIEFDYNFGSNHFGRYKKHGKWAYPIWHGANYIQGSPATPYIFDDIIKWEDVADGLMYWYLMPIQKREECGAEGRRWAMNEGGINSENMCKQFVEAMEFVFDNFVPESNFSLHTDNEYIGHKMPFDNMGFEIPKIDINKIQQKIQDIK